jgi:hypothetical protein
MAQLGTCQQSPTKMGLSAQINQTSRAKAEHQPTLRRRNRSKQ